MNPKLIVALVIFAAAVLIFFLNSGDAEELPDETPSFATPYKCVSCEVRVDLKDSEYFAKMEEVGGEAPYMCDACSKRELYRLYVCYVCQTEFFGTEVPGQLGKCPKCNPPPAEYVETQYEKEKRERVLSF